MCLCVWCYIRVWFLSRVNSGQSSLQWRCYTVGVNSATEQACRFQNTALVIWRRPLLGSIISQMYVLYRTQNTEHTHHTYISHYVCAVDVCSFTSSSIYECVFTETVRFPLCCDCISISSSSSSISRVQEAMLFKLFWSKSEG